MLLFMAAHLAVSCRLLPLRAYPSNEWRPLNRNAEMKILLKSLLLFSLCCVSASAVEKVDLFEAGKDGYALYRIPGIVVTKQGTVLAYCEARKGDGDWGQIDVMMRRSRDGGKTWLPRQKIV